MWPRKLFGPLSRKSQHLKSFREILTSVKVLPTSVSIGMRALPIIDGLPHEHLVHLSILPADDVTRIPADVCLVIDVSGSMGNSAVIQGDDQGSFESGLSILDVVKHAAATVIESLGDQDRLSIVGFSDGVLDVDTFEPTLMTDAGRKQALRAVRALHPRGYTNLWAGLERGLNLMQRAPPLSRSPSDRSAALMVLTDGGDPYDKNHLIEPPSDH